MNDFRTFCFSHFITKILQLSLKEGFRVSQVGGGWGGGGGGWGGNVPFTVYGPKNNSSRITDVKI